MSSAKRKIARNPKTRKGVMGPAPRYTHKLSNAARLRRASSAWKRRHPGSDGWRTAPPFPGTQIGQDLYIAKTRPAENGITGLGGGDAESGYAIFTTRAKAKQGNPYEALGVYHDPATMRAMEKNYGDDYKFHRLVNVRGGKSKFGR